MNLKIKPLLGEENGATQLSLADHLCTLGSCFLDDAFFDCTSCPLPQGDLNGSVHETEAKSIDVVELYSSLLNGHKSSSNRRIDLIEPIDKIESNYISEDINFSYDTGILNAVDEDGDPSIRSEEKDTVSPFIYESFSGDC